VKSWRDRAACKGLTGVMFVARGQGRPSRANETQRRIRYAQAICATCPVLAECGAYADQLDAAGTPITEMVIAGRDPRSLDLRLRRRHAV
jgi:hypothetical protein